MEKKKVNKGINVDERINVVVENNPENIIREIFDSEFYSRQIDHLNIEVKGDLLQHFLSEGYKLGLDPEVGFSCSYYLEINEDVSSANVNPFVHYLNVGKGEGRAIRASDWVQDCDKYAGFIYNYLKQYFDVPFYMSQLSSEEHTIHPVLHYLKAGAKKGYDPSRFFSTTFYEMNNRDLGELNPLVHYEFVGRQNNFSYMGREGLGVHNYFDGEYYLATNEDVKDAGIDPFVHYMHDGWREGRDPSPYFSISDYLKLNPDVKQAGINPLMHYANIDQSESRLTRFKINEYCGMAFDLESKYKTLYLPNMSVDDADTQEIVPVIHIHCYYIDVFEGLVEHLGRLNLSFKLIVTTPHENEKGRIKKILKSCKITKYKLIICPNIGRDLAPLIVDVLPLLKPNDVVLHIHTKKSVEKEAFGKDWFEQLSRDTINNKNYILNLLKIFSKDKSVGVVAPQPYPEIRPFMVWGENSIVAEELVRALDLPKDCLSRKVLDFPAGSFFWFRPQVFNPLKVLNLTYDSFPKEPIPDDGTLAHTIERVIFLMSEREGLTNTYISELKPSLFRPLEKKIDLSVIIPFKNAMPWLSHCVQSVLLQDAKANNVEIVLVDNNSTDGGGQYADLLSDLYSEVVSTSESKPGVGATRNKGLKLAKGEYVMFIDADDVILPSAITDIMSVTRMEEDKPDFVASSLQFFSEDFIGRSVPHGQTGGVTFFEHEISEKTHVLWSQLMSDFGPCAKLYKKEFLVSNKIKFPHMKFEDNYFIYRVLSLAGIKAILSKSTYLYRKLASREGDTESTRMSMSSLLDQLDVMNEIARGIEDFKNPILRSMAVEKLTNKFLSEAERIGLDDKFLKTFEKKTYFIQALKVYGDYDLFKKRLNKHLVVK